MKKLVKRVKKKQQESLLSQTTDGELKKKSNSIIQDSDQEADFNLDPNSDPVSDDSESSLSSLTSSAFSRFGDVL